MPRGGLKRTIRINPTSVLTGSVLDALCMRTLKFPHCAWEASRLQAHVKDGGLWRAGYQVQEDYSWALGSHRNLPCEGLFLLSNFSCLEGECTTLEFWKLTTCLVSEVHSWRGILPGDESYLMSHNVFDVYGIEMIPGSWDFRLDAEMNENVWNCWDGMYVFCMWEGYEFVGAGRDQSGMVHMEYRCPPQFIYEALTSRVSVSEVTIA